MITITAESRELSKIEKYLMTQSPALKVIKDVEDGTSLKVVAWCEFIDTKEDGTKTELLSVLDDNKVAYSCQSATFKRSFKDIANLFEGDTFTIVKTSGTTNAGRPYVNCELDVNAI